MPIAPNGERASRRRRASRSPNTSSAAASKDGATTTSVNTEAMARAVASSTSPFTATIPPNALTGSAPWARAYASPTVAATAAPHGLACLTTTAAGPSRRLTSRHAASVSSTLRYERSRPCHCTAESHQLSTPGNR